MSPRLLSTCIALGLGIGLTAAAGAAPSDPKRLSLNPYGSMLANGASLLAAQSKGPLILPDERPEFAQGFTVPMDYEGGPLVFEALVSSDETYCTFALKTNFIFHTRTGREPIGTDLLPLEASVNFVRDNQALYFQAPATAREAVLLRYEIREYALPLEAGDGINVGFFRAGGANGQDDTCGGALHVNSMSVLYNDRTSPGSVSSR